VFLPNPSPFFASVFTIPTFTGGSGKKHSAYALATRLAIATKLGKNVSEWRSSGMCRSAGTSGSAERRSV
jgi:hypothetical protein